LGSGKTLRQLASERFDSELDLIGTPDDVSDKVARAMEEVSSDGFLISTPFQRPSRRFINEVCEGLVPALQPRGLVRQAYTRSTLRETAARVFEHSTELTFVMRWYAAPGGPCQDDAMAWSEIASQSARKPR
jgi:hypothetical protein